MFSGQVFVRLCARAPLRPTIRFASKGRDTNLAAPRRTMSCRALADDSDGTEMTYRYDKRIHKRWTFGPGERKAMDIAFTPLFKAGGDKRLTLEQGLLRLRYKAALAGDLAALRELLRLIRDNDAARDKQMRALNWNGFVQPYEESVSAAPAMLLLRIGHWVARSDYNVFRLAPWVADVADARVGPFSAERWQDLRQHEICSAEDLANVVPYSLEDDPNYCAGPPKRPAGSTRFKKGQSGNPRGRPRKSARQPRFALPFGGFLEEFVEISIDGAVRQMTRAEMLIWQAGLRAVKGDEAIQNLLARHVNAVRHERFRNPLPKPTIGTIVVGDDDDDVDDTIIAEPVAREWTIDDEIFAPRCRKFALLQPWIVEAAVQRLAPGALNEAEQKVVVRATSKPHTVAWPEWWAPALRKRVALKPGEPRVRTLRWPEQSVFPSGKWIL